jgi:hypothetical protein
MDVWNAFNHVKTTGVGIVIPYPYLVVDIDGEEGAQNWMRDFGHVPDRWVAKTARGLHLWYCCVEPTGNGKLAEKLDLKGQGGYVAAPPSLHPDGPTYEWVAEPSMDYPPYEAPDALADWIANRNFDRERRMTAGTLIPRVSHRSPLIDGMLYPTHNFDGVVSGLTKDGEGNRNNYLHWAAATLAEEFATDEDLGCLYDAAIAAGLTPTETKRTIRSAMKAAGR